MCVPVRVRVCNVRVRLCLCLPHGLCVCRVRCLAALGARLRVCVGFVFSRARLWRVRLCVCVLTHRAAWHRLAVQGSAIDVAIHADVGPAPADVAATIDPAVRDARRLRCPINSSEGPAPLY
jgi:hypothetical protein